MLLLIQYAFRIYEILLIIRILLSWVPVNEYSKPVELIYKLTDPYLDIFRKIIPPFGMVDISPIFAFIALGIIEQVVYKMLLML